MTGSGTLEAPYIITSKADLQAIEDNLDSYYELGSNVDASGTGEGFDPIISFTGQLDGKGYTITGLFINRPAEDYVGLIGFIDSNVVLRNISMTGVDITGRNYVGALFGSTSSGDVVDIDSCNSAGSVTAASGGDHIGGLIGQIHSGGTVDDCYSSCTVSGDDNVGGLIGYSRGIALTSSYATGTVTGTGSNAGGLIGKLWDDTLSKCYATGNASGLTYVGGLVGRVDSTGALDDCYARGDATADPADWYAGGLIGRNDEGIIDDCYSTGAATGSSYVGGFCGEDYGTITNCFWDAEASGNATSDGGTDKTTDQMQTEATFTDAGWNFATIWFMVASSYPILAVFSTVSPTVTTQATTSILETTATGNGNVTALGDSPVTQHGHCWDTSINPTTSNNKTTKGAKGSTGAFTSSITGLSAGTLYYTRAYAINTAGTSYGDNVTFTADSAPTITTQTCQDVIGTTATGRGTIADLGGDDATAHGHCWKTTANPTTSSYDGIVDNGAKTTTGTFTSAITSLIPGTGYYVRAYATNTVGTSYGINVYFIGSLDRAGYIWMEGSNLHGFDENAVERTYVHTDDVDDTPVDAATTDPISSNWAYDFSTFGNRTHITGMVISDNYDGSVAVSAGTGWCKITNSINAEGKFFSFDGANVSSGNLTDLSVNYIYLDYNAGGAGVPGLVADTTGSLFYDYDHIVLGCVFMHGNHGHIINSEWAGLDAAHRTKMRFYEEFAGTRTSGLVTTATGTRQLVITQGRIWVGLTQITSLSFDTSAVTQGTATATASYRLIDSTAPFTANDVDKALKNTTSGDEYTDVVAYISATELRVKDDIFENGEGYDLYDAWDCWHTEDSGTTWEHTEHCTQIDSARYNAVGTGLVSLAAASHYGVYWLYIDQEGDHLHMVYGQKSDIQALAEIEPVPALLPPIARDFGILIAKILVQRGGSTLIINYPWVIAFPPSAATDHGNLAGLTHDDHTQYILADGTRAITELTLTPKASSSGPEGTIFYNSGDDKVYVGTEA